MPHEEAFQLCALFSDRELAESAAKKLDENDIPSRLSEPDERTHRLAPGTVQLSVPGTVTARARAILNSSD